mmetsp:Transcript_16954/g.20932  ORF Transcript_16954/g.20932 Transcript_16954/m.20932 type:complete len:92 (+) Transcript_16954:367-642(+)
MISSGRWNIDGTGPKPIPERFKKFAQEKFTEMWTDGVKIGLSTIAAALVIAKRDGILSLDLVFQIFRNIVIMSVGGFYAGKLMPANPNNKK